MRWAVGGLVGALLLFSCSTAPTLVWAAGRNHYGDALAAAANTASQLILERQQQERAFQDQQTLDQLEFLLRRQAEEERFQREMKTPQGSDDSDNIPASLKFCPVGGELYPATVKFCPNHGVELRDKQ